MGSTLPRHNRDGISWLCPITASDSVEGMESDGVQDGVGMTGVAVDECHVKVAVLLLESVELLDEFGDLHDALEDDEDL